MKSRPVTNRRTAILPDESGRVFLLDAERLYESGVADAFTEILPILTRLGGVVPVEGQGKFEIHLGGRSFVIVPPVDDPRESRWLEPALRFLSAFDGYLEQQGLSERFYYPHIDNDSLIGCLTARMTSLVEELGRAIGRRVTLQRAPRWDVLVKD
jgi:hypothetical protein